MQEEDRGSQEVRPLTSASPNRKQTSSVSEYPLVGRDGQQRLRGSQQTRQSERRAVTNVSDDTEAEAEKETANFVDGYPYLYSCERILGSEELKTLELTYDYEYVASTKGEDETSSANVAIPSSIKAVEWGLTWVVGDALGLHGCHFDKQHTADGNIPSLGKSSLIVSVSSLPADQVDTTKGTFGFIVEWLIRLFATIQMLMASTVPFAQVLASISSTTPPATNASQCMGP